MTLCLPLFVLNEAQQRASKSDWSPRDARHGCCRQPRRRQRHYGWQLCWLLMWLSLSWTWFCSWWCEWVGPQDVMEGRWRGLRALRLTGLRPGFAPLLALRGALHRPWRGRVWSLRWSWCQDPVQRMHGALSASGFFVGLRGRQLLLVRRHRHRRRRILPLHRCQHPRHHQSHGLHCCGCCSCYSFVVPLAVALAVVVVVVVVGRIVLQEPDCRLLQCPRGCGCRYCCCCCAAAGAVMQLNWLLPRLP